MRTATGCNAALAAREIGTAIHFPIPNHLQAACRTLGYTAGDLPHTERAAREVLSIPMYPELTPEQQAWVAAAVVEAAGVRNNFESNVPAI